MHMHIFWPQCKINLSDADEHGEHRANNHKVKILINPLKSDRRERLSNYWDAYLSYA
jgi:hypothetical protein